MLSLSKIYFDREWQGKFLLNVTIFKGYLIYFDNLFSLVVCQIVLIKKFRLTINIIKRIFLRIKS